MPLDSQNMLGVLKNFPIQCRNAMDLAKGMSFSGMKRILVIGMGGSAIGGDLLKAYMASSSVPVDVVRDYSIPGYVDKETLVFAVSYSGNTEETLSAVQQAKAKKAKIVGITSGGELPQYCDTVLTITKGYQPRAALGYLFFPMLGIAHNSGMVRIKNEELNELLTILKNPDVFEAAAEAIVKKIKGKIPLVYASQKFAPVAFRWKTQINENAKWPAFTAAFSEMNHNELVSFKHLPKEFVAIFIQDSDDHPQIKKRMDYCREILEHRVDVVDVHMKGTYMLSKMFTTIYIGDFVSYYLALWHREDPTPVEVIEKLKKKLK